MKGLDNRHKFCAIAETYVKIHFWLWPEHPKKNSTSTHKALKRTFRRNQELQQPEDEVIFVTTTRRRGSKPKKWTDWDIRSRVSVLCNYVAYCCQALKPLQHSSNGTNSNNRGGRERGCSTISTGSYSSTECLTQYKAQSFTSSWHHLSEFNKSQ